MQWNLIRQSICGTNRTAELSSMVEDAMEGSTGVRLVNLDDGEYYMAGAPMGTVGWTPLYAFEQEMADQPAEMLTASYQEYSGRSRPPRIYQE